MRYLQKFKKWLSERHANSVVAGEEQQKKKKKKKKAAPVPSPTSIKTVFVQPPDKENEDPVVLVSKKSIPLEKQVAPTPAVSRSVESHPLEFASTCCIPTTWSPFPLVNKFEVNHNTTMFEFGLPEGKRLELPVCGCLLLLAPGANDAVRPYTPVSDSGMVGKFQLLIKVYKEWGVPHECGYRPAGVVSNYINSLAIGDTAQFKHIKFNVKYPYPFKSVKTITMLCVGSGIAPMIQTLRKLLTTEGDNTRVVLLYGNRTVADILMRPLLEQWSEQYPLRLKVVHVIGSQWSNNTRLNMGGMAAAHTLSEIPSQPCPPLPSAPQIKGPNFGVQGSVQPQLMEQYEAMKQQEKLKHHNSNREAGAEVSNSLQSAGNASSALGFELGWVNEATIRKHAFPPAEDTRVFVCGMPAVYESLCGPRGDASVKEGTALHLLGYCSDMVVKF